jgi:DNA-directed RNA polymerase subunit RPC12/RpoP
MKIDILDKTNCPHCGANLIGNPIPDDIKAEYGNASHFSRIVGLYDQKTQRIKAYECPDCEKFLIKGKK